MLSLTTGYAIKALGFLAHDAGKAVFTKQLSEGTGIPAPYLAKLINILARKGFVETQRGISGGVLVTPDMARTTIFEICEALDDSITQSRCMLATAACSDERACPAHSFWKRQREREVEFLRQTTLSDIGDFESQFGRRSAPPKSAASQKPPFASERISLAGRWPGTPPKTVAARKKPAAKKA